MRRIWKPLGIGVVGGLLGVMLALVGWHLLNDHRDLHEMKAFLVQQIQAAQEAKSAGHSVN